TESERSCNTVASCRRGVTRQTPAATDFRCWHESCSLPAHMQRESGMDGSTTLFTVSGRRLALLLMLAVPLVAAASGARQGVKAQPGEIVLLRDVSTRPAYRMAPPGVALIADPKPQHEIAAALGSSGAASGMDELSDDDYAGLGAGQTGSVHA